MKNALLKKIFAVGLTGAMMFSMSGCGSSSSATEAPATEAPATEAAATEAATEAAATESGSVAGALEGVTLEVGTSGLFAPFSYYDEDGTTLIGFDLDLIAELQELLGFEISGEVQAMDYAALSTSVAEGKLDIALAALCATDQRKEVMNFSKTYCDSGQSVMINTETSPKEITGVDDLTGGDYKVAVEKGTASHMYAQANFPETCIEVHDTITTAYESLEQGRVDCLLQDTPGCAYYVKTVEGTKLATVGDTFNQGQSPYAIAISFDCTEANEGIVEIFDAAIDELTANGTMDELNAEWTE